MVYGWLRARNGHRHVIWHLCAGILSATVARFRWYDGLHAREELRSYEKGDWRGRVLVRTLARHRGAPSSSWQLRYHQISLSGRDCSGATLRCQHPHGWTCDHSEGKLL